MNIDYNASNPNNSNNSNNEIINRLSDVWTPFTEETHFSSSSSVSPNATKRKAPINTPVPLPKRHKRRESSAKANQNLDMSPIIKETSAIQESMIDGMIKLHQSCKEIKLQQNYSEKRHQLIMHVLNNLATSGIKPQNETTSIATQTDFLNYTTASTDPSSNMLEYVKGTGATLYNIIAASCTLGTAVDKKIMSLESTMNLRMQALEAENRELKDQLTKIQKESLINEKTVARFKVDNESTKNKISYLHRKLTKSSQTKPDENASLVKPEISEE